MIHYSTSTTTIIGVTNPNSLTTPVTHSNTAGTTIMTSATADHDTTTGIVISSYIAVMSTAINNHFCTTTTNIAVSCISTATVGSSADTTSNLLSS